MLQTIIELLESAKKDAEKFEKGNKAAGTRTRKYLLQISKETKVARKAILDKI